MQKLTHALTQAEINSNLFRLSKKSCIRRLVSLAKKLVRSTCLQQHCSKSTLYQLFRPIFYSKKKREFVSRSTMQKLTHALTQAEINSNLFRLSKKSCIRRLVSLAKKLVRSTCLQQHCSKSTLYQLFRPIFFSSQVPDVFIYFKGSGSMRTSSIQQRTQF